MSIPLDPVIATAGLTAVVNAKGSGVKAEIAAIAVGRGIGAGSLFAGYAPAAAATGLAGEMARVPILSGQRLDPVGFQTLARVPATLPGDYAVREVGWFLATGELLALWSHPTNIIAYKGGLADLDLSFDLYLEALPVEAITLQVVEPGIPEWAATHAWHLATEARLFISAITARERQIAAGQI